MELLFGAVFCCFGVVVAGGFHTSQLQAKHVNKSGGATVSDKGFGSNRINTDDAKLNEFIDYFEPLSYQTPSHQPRRHHRSSRRRTSGGVSDTRDKRDSVRLQFSAHSRVFKVRLSRDASIFSDDIVFESSNGEVEFDMSRVYTGLLEDDAESEVSGLFTPEGLFDGTITTSTHEEYFVEPASHYFPPARRRDFHSVIYRADDVHFPIPNRTCLSEQLRTRSWTFRRRRTKKSKKRRKSRKRTSTWTTTTTSFRGGNSVNDHTRHRKLSKGRASSAGAYLSWKDNLHNYWRQEDNLLRNDYDALLSSSSRGAGDEWWGLADEAVISDDGVHMRVVNASRPNDSSRWRRQTQYLDRGVPVELDGEAPWVQVQENMQRRSLLDPKKTTCMLYLQADHLFFSKMGSVEACIETMTRHVQRVNTIYRVTDFDQDGHPDNISFMIKRIKVHTPEALKDPNYRFPDNYGVEKFLELFSEEDYDAFCLAYMFTYRDFEGGTLGLAWTGDLKNAGGVCEKNGHYRGSLKSLNTGIVTLLNYGKHVPPAVSHVTLAHEIGHNFGSPHDPEDERMCTPGGEDGNYIMFARATSGDKRNNNKFSPCSLKSINAVLNSKARDAKGCFTEPKDSICGNEVVEKGEECDCGWEEDCEESCCWPMRANHPDDEVPCHLRPNRTCSPSQGPCCTPDCQLKHGTKCRDDNGCRDASFCEKSKGPSCPPSNNKPNKTICNEEFVCYMGECTGSICIAYGLESCQCKRGPTEPATKACELCCKSPGEEQACVSSFEWNTPPYDIPDMHAKPGTPCDNYNGYCDVFQKCREVDPSGPLATLRRLLLSTESIASLKRWIIEHWWGVMLIFIGFIIVLAVVVKVFGKQPDSKAKALMNGGGGCGPPYSTTPTTAPSYRSTTNHAVTTALSRTNFPVSTATAAYANGHPPHPMTGNGWV